jgi:CRISPR/Cas system-associated exonuclease Cas4 (RecB family)
MEAGKVAHEVVINHVCGIKRDDRLPADLPTFQKPEYKVFEDYRNGYALYGFCDSVDFRTKTIMEYKTSSTPWSQGKFDKLMQIPFYALATHFRKIYMITSTADLQNFKVFYKEINNDDIKGVSDWIESGIKIIESGNFTSDLIDGKCPGCNYGPNCWYA